MINPSKWEMFFVLILIILVSLTALNLILANENVPWRIRRSYFLKFLAFWTGITIVILYNVEHHDSLSSPPQLSPNFHEEWRLYPSGALLFKDKAPQTERFNNFAYSDKPIIFITPTEYSVVQAPLLTRLGQALFPVRHMVQWVIVQLPLSSSPYSDQILQINDTDGITFKEAIQIRKDLNMVHLRNLDNIISRFGVPYKILTSSRHSTNYTTWAGQSVANKVTTHIEKGYLDGILWVVKSLSRGIILLGDEQYAYNTALFWELRKTRIASCWPVAFESEEVRLSMPLAHNIHVSEEILEHNIIGYNSDKVYENVPTQRSGFAIDLEYLRKSVSFKDYWKLLYDKPFINLDFLIPLNQIQVVGQGGTEVYVWKTMTEEMEWPTRIKMASSQINKTNVVELFRRAFGPRFYLSKGLISTEDNLTFYEDYDMEKNVKQFLDHE